MPDLDSARELGGAHARHRRARRPSDGLRADGHGLAARRAPSATRSRSPSRARCWPAAGRPTSASSCSGSAARMAVLSDLGVDARGRAPPGRGGDRLGRGAAGARAAAWRPRAAIRALAERPWDVLEAAPVVARGAGAARRVRSRAAARSRSAAPRCGSAPGRERKEDPIDHAVGIVVHAKPGDEVGGGRAARACARARRERAEQRRGRGARRLRARRRSRRAAAAAARDDRLMPELPEVETVRRRLAPAPGGPRARRGRDPRPPADRSRAARGGRRAARAARASRRSAGAASTS